MQLGTNTNVIAKLNTNSVCMCVHVRHPFPKQILLHFFLPVEENKTFPTITPVGRILLL